MFSGDTIGRSIYFLGWLLGMLSPVIVSRIYRHYKKSDLYSGISKEINHIKKIDSISHITSSYDRQLIEWLLKNYEKIEFPDPSILNFYRMQFECNDRELQAIIRYQAKPDDIALSLKKFPLLFLGLHISDTSLFSSELQVEIFELKNLIEILNHEIELSEKYFL